MILKKRTNDYRTPQKYYLVVGYYNGKAIAKDELNELYYLKCEEAHAPVGTVMEPELLNTIDKLDEAEKERIEKIYGSKED